MIAFKKHSGIYTLYASQELPLGLEEAWDFFSSPENLLKITPSHMGFKLTSKQENKVYPGQIISYNIRLLPGITSNWVTEITHVIPLNYFIDEQRIGPYSMWHHEHSFQVLPNGNTLIKDKISYKIPFGLFGHMAQALFIKKQLTSVFEYRFKTLHRLFP